MNYRLVIKVCLLGFLLMNITYSCSDDNDITEPQFVTSDIDLFWDVFDEYEGNLSEAIIRDDYINKGTVGLQDFAALKTLRTALKDRVRTNRTYYEAVRKNTLDLSDAINSTKQGLRKLIDVFHQARIPNVYFVIGAMSAGGKISGNGLLIAAEMFSKDDNTNLNGLSSWHNSVIRNREFLASIVVHESIHVQQALFGGSGNFTTVLEKSIQEGMADFIVKQVMPDEPFFNEHLHEYGDAREEMIWKEFELEMNLNLGSTEWLYTGSFTEQGHPADMGYYVGYKILEAYSAQFSSLELAIEAMLTTNDYEEIFKKSGYGSQF